MIDENIKEEKNDEIKNINLFISALDDSEEEVKIIIEIIKEYIKETPTKININIIGNSYVQSLIDKRTKLFKNIGKIAIDKLDQNIDIDGIIQIIGNKISDLDYPNINLRNDFYYYLINYEEYESLTLISSNDNDKNKKESDDKIISEFKDEVLEENYFLEEYDNLEEFRDIANENIRELLDSFDNDLDIFDFLEVLEQMDFSKLADENPSYILKEIISKGLNLSENEKLPDDLNPILKQHIEALENDSGFEVEEEEKRELEINEEEIIELLKEKGIENPEEFLKNPPLLQISDETFSNEFIFLNFAEFLILTAKVKDDFLDYEAGENDDGKDFYNSGTIFSNDLETILDIFKQKIIKRKDFKDSIKNPIDYINKNDLNIDDLKNIINEFDSEIDNFIDTYESLLIYMKGMEEITDVDDIDGEEYINLLSKLTKEMELTIDYMKDIKDCFEKI